MRTRCIGMLIAIAVAASASATTRSLVVPRQDMDMNQLLADHGLTVIQIYDAAVWVEGDVDGISTEQAFVKAFPDWDLIRTVHPFRVDQRAPVPNALEPGLYVIHFSGPIRESWAAAVHNTPGVTVIQSLPNLAMVIHVAQTPLSLTALPGVDWAGQLDPQWKISPIVGHASEDTSARAVLMMVNAPGLSDSLRRLEEIGASYTLPKTLSTPWFPLRVDGNRRMVDAVAGVEHVLWIEPDYEKVRHDERQGLAQAGEFTNWLPNGPGYKAWLASVGLDDISGVIVDVADDGWDTGDTSPGNHHPDFDDTLGNSRVIYQIDLCGDGNHGVGGHGTINQSIVLGDGAGTGIVDPDGYAYGTGVAPTARGGHTKIFPDSGSFCPSTMTEITSGAYAEGARIASNSWGASTYGGYSADSAEYDLLVRDANNDSSDGLQEFTVVFSAGNDGPSDGQTGSPGTAKNVITSGASENVRDDGVSDGCASSDANSFQDLTQFTSPGPTEDGRLKPDAVGPGNHIQGAASQYPGFNGSSVCDQYWPAGQTWYAWSSGTSHSAPGMAGTAALIHEWYNQRTGSTPSPAMTKAIMLASGTDIAGGEDGNGSIIDALPNGRQGWGLLNMSLITDGASKYTFDQGHVFTSSGQDFAPIPLFTVVDPMKPVRIMMVYTDAPGNPNASPSGGLANDLDLEVVAGGDTYLGNVFTAGYSTTGGAADAVNNVEAVYLPAGAVATFSARIIASNLTADSIPGTGTATDQDFALFIYNATDQSSDGVVSLSSPTYSCSDTIAITVSDEDLQNSGSVDVTLASDTESTPVTVTLTEDPVGSGLLTATYPTTGDPANPSDGMLSVANGDTVTVTYEDADNGTGSPETKTSTATVDCAGPVISAVTVVADSITDERAVITWSTDELASSQVVYGLTTPGTPAMAPGNTTNHAVVLTGLQGCSKYVYQVTSCDQWGNCTTDPVVAPFHTFTSGAKTTLFEDDVEGGTNGWTAEGDWAITNEDSSSPSHSWSDSPGGDYAASANFSLTSPVINLTDAAGPELAFSHIYDLESGYDYGYVEASTDGSTWSTLATFNGTQSTWTESTIDLSTYAGEATFQVRFRLEADGVYQYDGWHIDDIEVFAYGSCSAGIVSLNRSVYDCADSITISVTDLDLNTDPGVQETATVTIQSDTETTPESITVTEVSVDANTFSATVATTSAAPAADGMLSIASGDLVTVTYEDADDGTGSPATATAFATIDCETPIISGLQVSSVTPSSAVVTWTTNEVADSGVDWYTTDPPASGGVDDPTMTMSHAMTLTGLNGCTTHYFTVQSEDPAGHVRVTNERSFTTAEAIPATADATGLPLAIPDSPAAGITSDIVIANVETVADVNVLLNITHTYDGDLDIYLMGPDGTTVELSTDNGSSGDNFVDTVFDDDAATPISGGTAPFTGSFQPETPLSVLNGKSAAGTWQLTITDDAGGDTGTLDGWQLQLTLSNPCFDTVFNDGFESGDHTEWSNAQGMQP
jgi:subtilisin-like proprotein convertase family protein